MLHFGNVGFAVNYIEKMLRKDMTVESIVSVVRLLDSINSNTDFISSNLKLIQNLESVLLRNQNFKLLSIDQSIRILSLYAHAQEIASEKRFNILDRLVRMVDERIQELEEQDVLKL